ncbi:hypothetical protein SUT503_13960 [Streptococcus parasuis]|nr:hypothetical protein SUT380_14250 [Streptococcus parasuis]BCP64338.1 hypothetical protein SUT503_13960 [Streptococcus parasuis]GIC31212.1 hypothetical protein SUT328_14360 [Streptococcus parasuis]
MSRIVAQPLQNIENSKQIAIQGQESISFRSYSPSILAYSSSVSTYE